MFVMKIDKIYDKLIDLSKNNRLLNFKDRLNNIKVMLKNSDDLMNLLFNKDAVDVYNSDKFIYKVNGHDYNNEIFFDDIYKYIKDSIKDDNIVLHKNKGSINATLKRIKKLSEEALTEKGINPLYLTLGMLEYSEDNMLYKAPILLVPIKIIEGSLKSYKISLYEEEVMLNPALKYKLEMEYNIKLDKVNIDIIPSEYFKYLKKSLVKTNWKIIEESYIGLFLFNKINMYEDMKENKKEIEKHHLISSLLNATPLKDRTNYYSDDSIYNIYDADFSQMEAIKAVRDGKSIVLEGPPGTGKSQTITNIIAEAMSEGKKVLFVSEKMAALNVVYEKLKKKGLDEFSLELHSLKTNKRNVINELYNTIHIKKSKVVDKKVLDEIYVLDHNLDTYTTKLHKKIDKYNLSLYEILSKYYSLNKYKIYDDYNFNDLSYDKYLNIIKIIEEYNSYNNIIGDDYREFAFYGYISDNSKKSIKALKETKETLTNILRDIKLINDTFNIKINNLDEYLIIIDVIKVIMKSKYINHKFLDFTKLDLYIDECHDLIIDSNLIKENDKVISLYFNSEIYKDKYISLYDKLKSFEHTSFKVFNKEYKKLISNFKDISKAKKSLKYKYLEESLKLAREVYEKRVNFEMKASNISLLVRDDYEGFSTDFKEIYETLEAVLKLKKIKDYQSFKYEDNDYKSFYNALNLNKDGVLNILNTKYLYDNTIIDLNTCDIKDLYKKTVGKLEEMDYYKFNLKLNNLIKKEKENNVFDLINKALDNKVKAVEIKDVFDRVYFNNILKLMVQNNLVLKQFNTLDYDTYKDKFNNLDKEMLDLHKSIIIERLEGKKPNLDIVSEQSALAVICREHEKKRKQKSVREIINEYADFIQTLKPLFLMSPESVSTYLDFNKVKFDLVVFDEASQIFPSDALCAIARASQMVIVGDSKQMPPTSFFNSINIDETEDDVMDFESILDLAKAILPIYQLKWHYRSQNEELIMISNKEFYDNSLITTPSAKRHSIDFGLEGYYVSGIYNREMATNENEALKVVELCKIHKEKYGSSRSLGVVTFSISQRRLIERKLEEAQFSLSNEEEPFFVKNLESVQGDERDTIIFSVGYGYDERGKFISNFGPLNKEGGERRLNVAISRAKINMKVVSSIKANDINSKNKGARLLASYLDFVYSNKESSLTEEEPSPFIKTIKTFLEEKGYTTKGNVGYSNYKINLCVYDNLKENFIAAIEDDGEIYHNLCDTTNRNRLREEMLKHMGFNYIRVWSMGWYNDEFLNKKILLDKLEYKNEVKKEETVILSKEDTKETFREYQYADYKSLVDNYLNKEISFEDLFTSIVEIEAPISEHSLIDNISKIYGYDKYNKNILSEYELDKAMNLDLKKYEFINGFIFIKNKPIYLRVPSIGSKARDISDISPLELAYGMKEILINNKFIDKDSLYKTMRITLGYKKMTDKIIEAFDKAFEELNKIAVVIIKDEKINVIDV